MRTKLKSKTIKGHENYIITSNGEVFSIKSGEYRKLTPQISRNGYLSVTIDGKSKDIHRLVAEHFIPNPEHKDCVHHKDGDKENNDYHNLLWISGRLHGILHSPSSNIINNACIWDKYTNKIWESPKKLSRYLKCSPQDVVAMCIDSTNNRFVFVDDIENF